MSAMTKLEALMRINEELIRINEEVETAMLLNDAAHDYSLTDILGRGVNLCHRSFRLKQQLPLTSDQSMDLMVVAGQRTGVLY